MPVTGGYQSIERGGLARVFAHAYDGQGPCIAYNVVKQFLILKAVKLFDRRDDLLYILRRKLAMHRQTQEP